MAGGIRRPLRPAPWQGDGAGGGERLTLNVERPSFHALHTFHTFHTGRVGGRGLGYDKPITNGCTLFFSC